MEAEITEINQKILGNNIYDNDQEIEELTLTFSKKDYEKIKAGAYYNDYDSVEEFIIDTAVNGVETDKQRHLKGKETTKVKR